MKAKTSAAALCATVAASLTPASSLAGVMSAAGAVSVSLPAPTDRIEWRAYPRRHRPWHMGWRYGWPHYRIGTYASAPPAASAAPSSACNTFGVLGAASPTCDSWGVYGAGYPACSCWSVYNPY